MGRNFGKSEGYKCVIGGIGSYCTYIHKNIHQLEIGGGRGGRCLKITKIPKAFRVNEEIIKQPWKWDEVDMFYKQMKRFVSNFELGG